MGAFGVLGFGMMSQSRLRLIDVSIKRQTLQKRDIQLLQHRVNNICGSLTWLRHFWAKEKVFFISNSLSSVVRFSTWSF